MPQGYNIREHKEAEFTPPANGQRDELTNHCATAGP